MTDIKARIEQAKKSVTGNESLLDMLDAEGATELLNWGIELAGRIARTTENMDEATAEQNLEPRLKALRQFMRAAGNWAAGKYTDFDSRAQLRDKVFEHLRLMYGETVKLPSEKELDASLSIPEQGSSAQQLILKLKQMFAEIG